MRAPSPRRPTQSRLARAPPSLRPSRRVASSGGCNHITCAKCKYEWCWLCRGKYTAEHFRQQSGCKQLSNDFFAEVALALADAERGDQTEAGGLWAGWGDR